MSSQSNVGEAPALPTSFVQNPVLAMQRAIALVVTQDVPDESSR